MIERRSKEEIEAFGKWADHINPFEMEYKELELIEEIPEVDSLLDNIDSEISEADVSIDEITVSDFTQKGDSIQGVINDNFRGKLWVVIR